METANGVFRGDSGAFPRARRGHSGMRHEFHLEAVRIGKCQYVFLEPRPRALRWNSHRQ